MEACDRKQKLLALLDEQEARVGLVGAGAQVIGLLTLLDEPAIRVTLPCTGYGADHFLMDEIPPLVLHR